MHAFCKRFGEPVRQGFQHDGAVVVMVVHEVFFFGLDTQARGDGEHADIVFVASGVAVCVRERCDEIRQTTVGVLHTVVHRLFGLLAQTAPSQCALRAGFIGPQHNVVAHAVGRVQTDHRMRVQPSAFDQTLQHALAVAEHPLRFCADDLVFQNRREGAGQIPGLEKRPPIDIGFQLCQIKVFEQAFANETRCSRSVC